MLNKRGCSKLFFIIGGFLCYLIADGCTFSIGILYNEFLKTFHESKAKTAVLAGLIYAVPQLLGSFVCPLVDAIGSGYGAIIGGLILALSFFVSQYVSFQVLYLTLGLFASIGLEMTYVSGIMAVTKGFAKGKFLGLALGITVSGSGIGVFVFNPLLNYLIEEYTLFGAMLIESALFLNIIVAGCLFKLATVLYKQPKEKRPPVHIEVVPDQTNYHSIIRQISQSHSAEALDLVGKQPLSFIRDRRSSVILTKTQAQSCEPFYKPVNPQLKASSLDRRLKPIEPFSVNLPVDERSASFVNRLSQYGSQNIKVDSSQNTKGSRHMSQETMSSQPSLTIDTTEEVSRTDNAYIQSDCEIQLITTEEEHNSILKNFNNFLEDLKHSMHLLVSDQVWTNGRLIWYYVATMLFAMSVVVVWTFTYDRSINIGIEEANAALLVSLVGAGSCLGQIFFGYISDYIHAISLFAIGCFIGGSVTILLGYTTVYWCLAILHFMFGFSQGVNYSLFSVILVQFASLELYPASLAIYLLFSGISNLIGTSLADNIHGIRKHDYKKVVNESIVLNSVYSLDLSVNDGESSDIINVQ